MKLIDILVQELPKRGGWPEQGVVAVQDCEKWICFSTLPEVEISGLGGWHQNGGEWVTCIRNCEHLAEDYSKTIITREQYEAALAASTPEWNGNGLPPVVMEIEYKFTKVNYRTDFSRGKVLAYGMHNVFIEHWSSKNEFIQPLDKIEFRPIRSEADKQRDIIISKIEKAYKDCPHSDAVPQAIYEAIEEHIRID